ncbi:MAG: ferritin family protein [Bacteroidota bacterium]
MKKTNIIYAAIILSAVFLSSCGGNKADDKTHDIKDSVKTGKTIGNLKKAITGETTAKAKYKMFSEKAKEEGYDEIAGLFAATSRAESIHADNNMKALEKMGEKFDTEADSFEVKSTKENMEAAIKSESYEVENMYPDFIKTAEAEQADDAKKSFNWAIETEKKHIELFQKTLDALTNKKEKELSMDYCVCPKCGNTYIAADIEEICEFCGTGKDKFIGISWKDVNRK